MIMGYVGKSMTAAGGRGAPTVSVCTTDTGSKSTVHQDLDNDAGEQVLLEKFMRDTLRVLQRYIEILRAEPDQKGRAEHLAAWRCWLAEQAGGASNKHPSSKATAAYDASGRGAPVVHVKVEWSCQSACGSAPCSASDNCKVLLVGISVRVQLVLLPRKLANSSCSLSVYFARTPLRHVSN